MGLQAAARDHQPGRLSDEPDVVRREYKAVELYAVIGRSPPKPHTQTAVQIRAARYHGLARPPSAQSNTMEAGRTTDAAEVRATWHEPRPNPNVTSDTLALLVAIGSGRS
jgi:hypothetical protein